jgi:ribonuclease R
MGERTGVMFQLGDLVKVQVVRVSLEDKKIDLEMIEGSTRSKRREQKEGKKPKRQFAKTVEKKSEEKKSTKQSKGGATKKAAPKTSKAGGAVAGEKPAKVASPKAKSVRKRKRQ